MNTEKNRQALGIIMTLTGAVFWGLCGSCGQYLFQYKEVTSDWLVPIRLTIDSASVIHQRQRKCICHVERSAGAAGHSDLCAHWHDALSIRIFHNDPVFQRRNSHGAAVHRTGHDPCVSVYSEPQKTENI